MSELRDNLYNIRSDMHYLRDKYTDKNFNSLCRRIEHLEDHIDNLIVVLEEHHDDDDGGLGDNNIKCAIGYKNCPKNPLLCVHNQLDKNLSEKICEKVVPEKENTIFKKKTAKMRIAPHSRYLITLEDFPVAHSGNLKTDKIEGHDYLDKNRPLFSINNLRGLTAQQVVDLEKKYGSEANANIAIGRGAEDIYSLRKGKSVEL